jgi:hypothetical protein
VKADGKRIPLDVKAGDLILFGKYTSQEVKLEPYSRPGSGLADLMRSVLEDKTDHGKTYCVRRPFAAGHSPRGQ